MLCIRPRISSRSTHFLRYELPINKMADVVNGFITGQDDIVSRRNKVREQNKEEEDEEEEVRIE